MRKNIMKRVALGVLISAMSVTAVPQMGNGTNTVMAATQKADYTFKKGTLTISGSGKFKRLCGDFEQNKKIKNIVIKSGNIRLANYSFSDAINLKSVKFANGIKELPVGLFMDCKQIKKLEIPASVKKIGNNAFANTDVQELVISSKTVTVTTCDETIPQKRRSSSYLAIKDKCVIEKGTYKVIDGNILSKDGKKLIAHNASKSYRYIYEIPEGVEEIDLSSIPSYYKKIYLPSSVTTITNKNNIEYKKLEGADHYSVPRFIIQSDKLSKESVNMLLDLTKGKNCYVVNIKDLQENGYIDKYDLKLENVDKLQVEVPAGVKEINKKWFVDNGYNIDKIQDVTLPKSVEKIADKTFTYCYNLNSVHAKGDLEIGARAFSNSRLVKFIVDGNCKVGKGAFQYSHLRHMSANKITDIEEAGFRGATVISVDGISVSRIKKYAFEYCDKLNFKMPDSVNYVEKYAFNGCESLDNISDNIKTVETGAFENCYKIRNLPKKIERIEDFGFNEVPMKVKKLPSNLSYIGQAALDYAKITGDISLPKKLSAIKSGNFCSDNKKYTVTITNPKIKLNKYDVFSNNAKLKFNKISNSFTLVDFASPIKKGTRYYYWTFKKVAGISGYEIKLMKDNNQYKDLLIKHTFTNKNTYEYSVKDLDINYYVMVRPYKNVNGKKVYGNWQKGKF